MKTTFLKNSGVADTDLSQLIDCAFEEAKEFRASKGVDRSIRDVEQYFSLNRGLLNVAVNKTIPQTSVVNGVPQAVKDAGIDCAGILINMDNISNLIETWMALVHDALIKITKPHDVTPTIKPRLATELAIETVHDNVKGVIMDAILAFTQGEETLTEEAIFNLIQDKDGGHDFVRAIRDEIDEIAKQHAIDLATETAEAIDEKMTDEIQESNYPEVIKTMFRAYARDRYAILKAPQYVFDYRDRMAEDGIEEVMDKFLFLESVKIKNYYAAPNTTIHNNGPYEFDVSSMTSNELHDAKECPGFLPTAIDKVKAFFKDCDRNWLDDNWSDTTEAESWKPFDVVPVLKGRIRVPGKDLKKFGLEKPNDLDNDNISYELVFWKIHKWIIYGAISLNKKPIGMYRVAGWIRTGDHVYDSKGITEIALPYQKNIDKSYNHLISNQEFSALGLWGVNSRKIAQDKFDLKEIRGGMALPVRSDDFDGGNDRPIFNVQINSNVNEILTNVAHNQQEMEEKAQISALSVGITTRLGSSIRTTGLGSLLQTNANRQTLSKIIEVECRAVLPFSKDQARVIMWTSNDPRITSGAIDVQVHSFTEIIRQGDDSENIDFFIQNVIGIMNAIAVLESQGVDTSGLKRLVGQYAETKGFKAEDVLGETEILQRVSNELQDISQNNVQLDGRSALPTNTELTI